MLRVLTLLTLFGSGENAVTEARFLMTCPDVAVTFRTQVIVHVFCPVAEFRLGRVQCAAPVCPGGGLQVPAEGVMLTKVVPAGTALEKASETPLSGPLSVMVMV